MRVMKVFCESVQKQTMRATMGETTRIIDSNGVAQHTRMTHGHIIGSLSSVFCAVAVFCGKKGMSKASVWHSVAA